jgi:NAD(P)H-hydrate epimerase
MVDVDRLMIEVYHIDLVQMMENAGRNLARLACSRFLDNDPVAKPVTVLAGSGGNGGGALVAARRLTTWGAAVIVMLKKPSDAYTGVPGHQLRALLAMGVPVVAPDQDAWLEAMPRYGSGGPALIIDGVIGYSLHGAPRGAAATMIRWANEQPAPILALDTPSGLDTTTGVVHSPTIRATATMTLALPKEGLRSEAAASFVGELYLADISVPPALYAALNPPVTVGSLFAEEEILRVKLKDRR